MPCARVQSAYLDTTQGRLAASMRRARAGLNSRDRCALPNFWFRWPRFAKLYRSERLLLPTSLWRADADEVAAFARRMTLCRRRGPGPPTVHAQAGAWRNPTRAPGDATSLRVCGAPLEQD